MNEYTSSFIHNNKDSWASKAAINTKEIFPDPTENILIQKYNIHQSFWQNIDTNDPTLINSPIYRDKILAYLSYYMDPEYHFSEQEMIIGFKSSVDTIMARFGKNPETKNFALNYLSLGFKEIGQEDVLKYIDQKYQSEKNIDDPVILKEYKSRISNYENLEPGNIAPNIVYSQDKINSLYTINSKYTVVAFWASWCTYCEKEMPLLEDLLATHDEIKALAISIDTEKEAYTNAIKKFPHLISYCDFVGWETEAAKQYGINGTPTFYLLDQNKKIIGKFSQIKALSKLVE